MVYGLFLVSGLAVGSLYALGGIGLVILRNSTGVLNFAYGAIAAFSAMSAWQVADWGLRVHRNALVLGRQKPGTPVGFSIRGFPAHVGESHVGRQIFVQAAEGVTDPGASCRIAFFGEAGVHENASRPVGVGLGMHAMQKGNVVDVLCHVRQQGGYHFSTATGGREVPRGTHQVAILSLEAEKFLFTG